MTDILTRLCLICAAVLFAAFAAVVGGRWLARQLAVIRPYLAAFIVFTFVAMNYAQKRSTSGGGSAPVPAPLFNSASVSTNGAWDFSAPSGATVHERWLRRGAAEFGRMKAEISAVVPYRLDADRMLDPEKAAKGRFTNDDATEARKRIARWICELE